MLTPFSLISRLTLKIKFKEFTLDLLTFKKLAELDFRMTGILQTEWWISIMEQVGHKLKWVLLLWVNLSWTSNLHQMACNLSQASMRLWISYRFTIPNIQLSSNTHKMVTIKPMVMTISMSKSILITHRYKTKHFHSFMDKACPWKLIKTKFRFSQTQEFWSLRSWTRHLISILLQTSICQTIISSSCLSQAWILELELLSQCTTSRSQFQ